MEAKQKIY